VGKTVVLMNESSNRIGCDSLDYAGLDYEWLCLMMEAKEIGVTPYEVRSFFNGGTFTCEHHPLVSSTFEIQEIRGTGSY